jgi:hypothetical protein
VIALILGTLLAVGTLAFVLYPLFFGTSRPTVRQLPESSTTLDKDAAVGALREIEFDRATGKLSDTDYADLKARYTREAVAAMRREDVAAAGERPSDDEIEAAVRAYREQRLQCATCGPRPEADAVFCSNCGRYLREKCAGCGAPVDAPDARFCVNCGMSLAA